MDQRPARCWPAGLAEGAQGTLLDIDFGTYPFVTSSTTTAAGACTGLGVAPTRIGEVIGIFKAYCTRVGSGPFPTELHDETGEALRAAGHEFGATTGRPRRCGWLDLPALKHACMLNGATQLCMMKADVLDAFDEVQVCTHYEVGRRDFGAPALPARGRAWSSPYSSPVQAGPVPDSPAKAPSCHPPLHAYVKEIEVPDQDSASASSAWALTGHRPTQFDDHRGMSREGESH